MFHTGDQFLSRNNPWGSAARFLACSDHYRQTMKTEAFLHIMKRLKTPFKQNNTKPTKTPKTQTIKMTVSGKAKFAVSLWTILLMLAQRPMHHNLLYCTAIKFLILLLSKPVSNLAIKMQVKSKVGWPWLKIN